jgi:hypothetical protein
MRLGVKYMRQRRRGGAIDTSAPQTRSGTHCGGFVTVRAYLIRLGHFWASLHFNSRSFRQHITLSLFLRGRGLFHVRQINVKFSHSE